MGKSAGCSEASRVRQMASCRVCVFAVWVAFVLSVGSADAVDLSATSSALDDRVDEMGQEVVPIEAQELVQQEAGKLHKALPCCLKNPIPKGCRCYVVKAKSNGHVGKAGGKAGGVLKMKTAEAKSKAKSARKAANLT